MRNQIGGCAPECAGRLLLAAALLFAVSGCTSRGITITSLPEGAEVSINYRVVGNTPVRVSFTHYGTYRLELRKEKYQTLVREENIHPPAYGYDPGAFVADNLIPARLNDEVYLHFVMKPLEEKADQKALSERDALLERARLARAGTATNPRTGEQVQVELARAPLGNVIEGAEDAVAPATNELTDRGKFLEKPPILEPAVKEIGTAKPEGPRLAKIYNVQVEQPKPSASVSPDGEQKVTAPRGPRTPKDEELIYAEPPKSQKQEVKSKK